ncbi:MAG: TonB-dependent receptor [Prevotellaceae bacterium]|jgi:iron complex outermembrane receptor protein|nr:TonB-dependent receptor [Prevotellaceae bacterium]
MYIKYIAVILIFAYTLPLSAQETDSLKIEILNEVTVSDSYRNNIVRQSALPVDIVDKSFMYDHFTGNFMQTLEYIPGIHSMDIGSGFSKPMIRGMGFNRIAVTENGIKQEGQQWGADHGLEIDAFGVERVTVRKGPSSLLYGSDAMGGVIELSQLPAPSDNMVYGELALLGKSVNGTLGGSVMSGVKINSWHVKLRFSEQHFADYRIPADTIVYLTQKLPVHNRRLKNTAGFERNAGLFSEYRKGRYYANYAVGNAYQKVGFFAGAHGIPDASRLQDDGDSRNIDLPYSRVNHLKISTRQQYTRNMLSVCIDAGFQNNHREEWSSFHTHYGNQPVPETNPDKELDFSLNTFNSSLKADLIYSSQWKHTFGFDVQRQRNSVGGYSFLLPEYERFTAGALWLSVFRPNDRFSLSGGLRYDYGKMDIEASHDVYLEEYLRRRNYADELVEAYKWRSRAVNRHFGDVSGSLGFVWIPDKSHQLKVNLGRSFRLPGANELASNGVHHGAFRHEQGNASLLSERGWQFDASYSCQYRNIAFTTSPFFSWYDKYIYLKPTGEWSVLPHAGQIYRYTGVEAIFTGMEADLRLDFFRNFTYQITGEYVYTYNTDEYTPLSFSPPASMRNRLTWRHKIVQFNVELQSVATQNRVAKNEDITHGVNLLHLGATFEIPLMVTNVDITFSLQNVLNTKYYNHLSFYRKVEIPEPGRNFLLLIKIPFINKLKVKLQ